MGRSAEPCDLHVFWPTKNKSDCFPFGFTFQIPPFQPIPIFKPKQNTPTLVSLSISPQFARISLGCHLIARSLWRRQPNSCEHSEVSPGCDLVFLSLPVTLSNDCSPLRYNLFAATLISFSLSLCEDKEEKTQIDETSFSLFGLRRTAEPNLGEMFLNSIFFFFSFLSDVGFDACFFGTVGWFYVDADIDLGLRFENKKWFFFLLWL